MEQKEYFQEDADRMFKEALTIIVLNWPVIKLAKEYKIEDEFKKTEKQIINEFISDLSNYVTKFDCKQDELELWLMQEVEYRFFTIVEDNSEKEIAKGILELFFELDDKKFTLFEEIKKMGAMMKDIKVDGQCGNEDDDSDDDSQADWEDSSQVGPDDLVMTEEEIQQLKQEQEEKRAEMESDGFTVVDKKKKR